MEHFVLVAARIHNIMTERVRIFGQDDQDHLDLVLGEDGVVQFVHYKLLPVQAMAQQNTWADVPMVSMPWTQLLDAIKQLQGGDDERETRIQGGLFNSEPSQ